MPKSSLDRTFASWTTHLLFVNAEQLKSTDCDKESAGK
jgi:hypothetical protein